MMESDSWEKHKGTFGSIHLDGETEYTQLRLMVQLLFGSLTIVLSYATYLKILVIPYTFSDLIN